MTVEAGILGSLLHVAGGGVFTPLIETLTLREEAFYNASHPLGVCRSPAGIIKSSQYAAIAF